MIHFPTGVDGLFSIDIDGDVGKDPNLMTLWFSQPSLGLPSKVRPSFIYRMQTKYLLMPGIL